MPRKGAADQTSIRIVRQVKKAAPLPIKDRNIASETSDKALPGIHFPRTGQGPARRHCCFGDAR